MVYWFFIAFEWNANGWNVCTAALWMGMKRKRITFVYTHFHASHSLRQWCAIHSSLGKNALKIDLNAENIECKTRIMWKNFFASIQARKKEERIHALLACLVGLLWVKAEWRCLVRTSFVAPGVLRRCIWALALRKWPDWCSCCIGDNNNQQQLLDDAHKREKKWNTDIAMRISRLERIWKEFYISNGNLICSINLSKFHLNF